MSSLLLLVAGTGCLMAAVAATLATLLVLHNPRNPAWLRTEFAAQAVSLALVALFVSAVAGAMHGFIAAGLGLSGAVAATLATLFSTGVLLWFLFGISERLRQAESGQSPFLSHHPRHPLSDPPSRRARPRPARTPLAVADAMRTARRKRRDAA